MGPPLASRAAPRQRTERCRALQERPQLVRCCQISATFCCTTDAKILATSLGSGAHHGANARPALSSPVLAQGGPRVPGREGARHGGALLSASTNCTDFPRRPPIFSRSGAAVRGNWPCSDPC